MVFAGAALQSLATRQVDESKQGQFQGVLASMVSLASIVVMGKSFNPEHKGGQSPIEAGQLGRALICGPYMTNFPGIMDDFKGANAIIEVPDSFTLNQTLADLINDPASVAGYGQRARDLCDAKLKAGPVYLAELAAYMGRIA